MPRNFTNKKSKRGRPGTTKTCRCRNRSFCVCNREVAESSTDSEFSTSSSWSSPDERPNRVYDDGVAESSTDSESSNVSSASYSFPERGPYRFFRVYGDSEDDSSESRDGCSRERHHRWFFCRFFCVCDYETTESSIDSESSKDSSSSYTLSERGPRRFFPVYGESEDDSSEARDGRSRERHHKWFFCRFFCVCDYETTESSIDSESWNGNYSDSDSFYERCRDRFPREVSDSQSFSSSSSEFWDGSSSQSRRVTGPRHSTRTIIPAAPYPTRAPTPPLPPGTRSYHHHSEYPATPIHEQIEDYLDTLSEFYPASLARRRQFFSDESSVPNFEVSSTPDIPHEVTSAPHEPDEFEYRRARRFQDALFAKEACIGAQKRKEKHGMSEGDDSMSGDSLHGSGKSIEECIDELAELRAAHDAAHEEVAVSSSGEGRD